MRGAPEPSDDGGHCAVQWSVTLITPRTTGPDVALDDVAYDFASATTVPCSHRQPDTSGTPPHGRRPCGPGRRDQWWQRTGGATSTNQPARTVRRARLTATRCGPCPTASRPIAGGDPHRVQSVGAIKLPRIDLALEVVRGLAGRDADRQCTRRRAHPCRSRARLCETNPDRPEIDALRPQCRKRRAPDNLPPPQSYGCRQHTPPALDCRPRAPLYEPRRWVLRCGRTVRVRRR